MPDSQKQIDELNKKLSLIELRQQQINSDLVQIRKELSTIRVTDENPLLADKVDEVFPLLKEKVIEPVKGPVINMPLATVNPIPVIPPVQKKKEKTPLEEFIGTNLLNKIGIAILVIGVGIGVQYAIDHDLINPLTRIVLGYLCGITLVGIAMRLKQKYANFSAVLLSGGIAVMYFITFAAYDFYSLIPQMLAFALMVIFTAFIVFAAIQYNMQVIAIIGLVGAYAVPFLLSDGSGRVAILFIYMTILNAGLLLLSFKKAWKALYYSAFSLTWIIFMAWFFNDYYVDDHLWIALIASSAFFITFYTTLLSYKLLQGEPLSKWDVVLLLANSFIYYGFGYAAIDEHANGDFFLGLFTLFNAIIHFLACYLIYKKQDATRDTFYFVAGLVLVFLTLAVPVQLEGNWVTLVWAGEAIVLFWIGRTKSFPVYERLSYTLIALTFVSLVQDWSEYYGSFYKGRNDLFIPFFLNIQFLSSILVCISFASIFKISQDKKIESNHWLIRMFEWGLPALLLVTIYFSFFKEIDTFWQQRHLNSEIIANDQGSEYSYYDTDLPHLKEIWLMIYSAVFLTALAIVNQLFVRNKILTYGVAGFSALLLFNFIAEALPSLAQLRETYLSQEQAQYYHRNVGNIIIRYVSILFMLPLLWVINKTVQGKEINDTLKKAERVFFHFIILALLSSELFSLMEMIGIHESDKLGLSILWGGYALALIVYGLIKDQKFIRITAISIFGVTLLKLFFYDLSSMGTIAKTIVMMVLGALLLIASFLYNKFKVKEREASENHEA